MTARLNIRLFVLLAVVSAPFLYFLYVIVHDAVTGGVVNHGSYVEVDLKALGNFPLDPVKDTIDGVPTRWRELDGKRVMLEGQMFAPNESSDDVREFELVYNIAKCCFGGPPKVQERVFVHVPASKSVQYGTEVRVVGKLDVKLKRGIDGAAVSLYEMTCESVEPL